MDTKKFLNNYNMLPKEYQQLIFNVLFDMDHPKNPRPITKQKYKFSELLNRHQKELMLSDTDVCDEVMQIHRTNDILSEDSFRKIKARNTQKPRWRKSLMKVLDISVEELESNLTDEFVSDRLNSLHNPTSIKWLFESLSDHDKNTVGILMRELQLLESGCILKDSNDPHV